jgi:hypothetical protein
VQAGCAISRVGDRSVAARVMRAVRIILQSLSMFKPAVLRGEWIIPFAT